MSSEGSRMMRLVDEKIEPECIGVLSRYLMLLDTFNSPVVHHQFALSVAFFVFVYCNRVTSIYPTFEN